MRNAIFFIFMILSVSAFACGEQIYDSKPENCASGTFPWSFTQAVDNGDGVTVNQTKFICAPDGDPPAGYPDARRV